MSRGINSIGIAQFYLGYLDKAIESFTEIIERVLNSIDIDRRYWLARGLGNKGVTLGALDRSAEAIAVYDDLLARFGTATELPLREQVAKAQTLKAGLHKSCRLCGKWD
jgi:tetratricopeptide (TPR) repeat protein